MDSKRALTEILGGAVMIAFAFFAGFGLLYTAFTANERAEAAETEPLLVCTELMEAPEMPTEPQYIDLGVFKVTGYVGTCEHCCGKSDGITASGTQANINRTVAMNRADMKDLGLEYGDSIYIEGIGERVVEDTGCGQGVLDVLCASHEDCYKLTGNYLVRGESNVLD